MSSLTDIAKGISAEDTNTVIRGPYRPYATLKGEVEVVISENKATMCGTDDLDVDVLVEAPTKDGFKYIRINIPTMRVEAVDGMNDEEISIYRLFVAKHCGDIADRLEEIWNANNS